MSASAAPDRADNPNALNAGTRLGEFELIRVLGIGGFGIVYLAVDHSLEREVAVKEYMPASLAGRTETMQVSIRSHSDAESFALGLKSFINEAKLLARFDHPSLLKVHRYWEANGTAYMAMPVLRGRTIKEVRAEMGGPPDEPWLRGVLTPLLGAIERLHSEGVYHRDIAPDNIQIEPDGRPVLLDFGAARRVLSDKTQTLTAILKPAYAPIEQYAEVGSVKQGPWTDLYALGATLHYVLLGRAPAPATARTVDEEKSSLTVELLPGCSEHFLGIIEWMLRPRPADRPQSVAELREVLEGRAPIPERGRRPDAAPVQPWERTDVLPPPPSPARALDLDLGDETTRMVPPPAAEPVSFAAATQPPLEMMVAERPRPAPAQRSALPAVLGGLLVLGAAAAYLFWPAPEQPAALPPAPAASVAAPVASAPVPVPAVAEAASAAASVPVLPAPPAAAEAASVPASAALAITEPVVVPPPVAKPAPRREATIRPAVRAEPAPAPAPVPAGPGPACGPREGVRYHVCMDRECGGSEFGNHPACQRWRADAGR